MRSEYFRGFIVLYSDLPCTIPYLNSPKFSFKDPGTQPHIYKYHHRNTHSKRPQFGFSLYYTADNLPRFIALALALTKKIGGRMEIITTFLGASPTIFHSIFGSIFIWIMYFLFWNSLRVTTFDLSLFC